MQCIRAFQKVPIKEAATVWSDGLRTRGLLTHDFGMRGCEQPWGAVACTG